MCDWGVMPRGLGFCDVEGAGVFCNGIQMLDVCVLDDSVYRWLDVGCTAAMDAMILKPYGFYIAQTFLYDLNLSRLQR